MNADVADAADDGGADVDGVCFVPEVMPQIHSNAVNDDRLLFDSKIKKKCIQMWKLALTFIVCIKSLFLALTDKFIWL